MTNLYEVICMGGIPTHFQWYEILLFWKVYVCVFVSYLGDVLNFHGFEHQIVSALTFEHDGCIPISWNDSNTHLLMFATVYCFTV